MQSQSTPQTLLNNEQPEPTRNTPIVCALVLALLCLCPSKTSAATPVGGIIVSDTTWNATNSPFVITSKVQVAESVILTIEAGAIVNGQDFYEKIDVFGTLQAIGTLGHEITFSNVLVSGAGDLLPTVVRMRYCHLVMSSPFYSTGGPGSILSLEDSIIENCFPSFYLNEPAAACVIQRNIFYRNTLADISQSSGLTGPTRISIIDNLFYESPIRFSFFSFTNSDHVVLSGNSFLSTNSVVIQGSQHWSAAVLATNNYWNTEDTNVIASMIYDRNDDLFVASYIYSKPFLTTPSPNVPVVPLPTILSQPQSRLSKPGSNITFKVDATGIGELTCKWGRNGVTTPGATNFMLTISNVTVANMGDYAVEVKNFAGGTVLSQPATLVVESGPVVTSPPLDQTVSPGNSAILSLSATGVGPLSYQWHFNGVAITGATNSTLVLLGVTTEKAGLYTVAITDATGVASVASVNVSLLALNIRPVLTIAGKIGNAYRIEFTENVTNGWTLHSTLTLSTNPQMFIDQTAPLPSRRFYRAVLSQ